MWYIAAVAGLAVAGALAGFTKARNQNTDKQSGITDILNSGSIHTEAINDLTMEEIDFMLAKLEAEEPPESVFGAMCYAPMAYPESSEYVCPVCGEKTMYSGNQISLVEWGLPGARRFGESINANTAFSVVLDESMFCAFCQGDHPDIEPALLLRVSHMDGTETVNSVSETDLRMLDSFLQGRLYYFTSNDGQQPLKPHIDRLRQLLGIAEQD